MDILALLNEVKQETLILRHPLAEADVAVRFAYAVGVGIAVSADGPLNSHETTALTNLSLGLMLSAGQVDKVLEAVAHPTKEMVKTVVQSVSDLQQQYLFLSDTRRIAACDGKEDAKERQALQNFSELLKMNTAEWELWHKLDEPVATASVFKLLTEWKKVFPEQADFVYRSVVYLLPDVCRQGCKTAKRLQEELQTAKAKQGNRPVKKVTQGNGTKRYDDSEGKKWDEKKAKAEELAKQVSTYRHFLPLQPFVNDMYLA